MNFVASLACVLALALVACGKSADKADRKGAEAENKTGKQPVEEKAAPAAALKATKLPELPLQADVDPSWKMSSDPMGGNDFSWATGGVSIQKNGGNGIKKETLDDDKALMAQAGKAVDVREEKLADGWLLAYKVPGVLPMHALMGREIAGQSYRCVVDGEQPADQQRGIDVCKSLRP